MVRKLRLEFPGACHHVINRGNYQADIFKTEQTKAAFEACLFEACRKSGWVLHAFVIMRNHYHLALETPEGNLVAGMQWLQATFAHSRGAAGKSKAYVSLSRGWALGSADFKQTLVKDSALAAESRAWGNEGAREIRQHAWEPLFRRTHTTINARVELTH